MLRSYLSCFRCCLLSLPQLFLESYLVEPMLVLSKLKLMHFLLISQKLVVFLLALLILITIKLAQ